MSIVTFRLLGPGTFDEDEQDFRENYAIERIERTIIGSFATRDDAREHMLQRRLGAPIEDSST